MDQSLKNYRQPWADDIVRRYRQAWRGTLAAADTAAAFAPGLVLHLHDQTQHGVEKLAALIRHAREATQALDLQPELVLAQGGMVLLFHRWTATRWHPDITGGDTVSNYCKVVLRVEDGRITDLWQQSPDFLYLLGKRPISGPMHYPRVVDEPLLVEDADGIRPTDDAMTREMSGLFKRMNDCFLNRASLREMAEIQNEDLDYDTGTTQGRGVQSWKTFAYALHTSLGTQRATRFDDLYVRSGDRLRVFLRATPDAPSPFHLQCAAGLIASMSMTARGGRIQSLTTRIENYIQFLDTDLTRHGLRLKTLFQGQREPVVQAPVSAEPLAAAADSGTSRRPVGVAIVGMAGRFPQCNSVTEFWDALRSGRTLISPFPTSRPQLYAGTDIRRAGFIDDVEQFDATYFRILPEEAAYIDPQQRLLMQEIVHAMEDSGHPAACYAGARTGLFIATLCEDHQKLLQECGRLNEPRSWAGNENAMFPAKLARHFNIQGPCRYVNAECTSALVALHEAAALIRAGEIDQAIVGATNLLLHSYGFAVRRDALLTTEPEARLFGKDSRGQLRGEAIVAVVLKALPRAIDDGDRIHGLLAGSAVNNSGRTLSLVAGHVPQQSRAITDAWRAAGVDGGRVSLIECHASGTRGGDFAEVAAVRQAFAELPGGEGSSGEPCRLATAKGATGHAEAASGLVSLVKVLLQLRHHEVLAVHGLGELDPELPFDPQRFVAASASAPWQRGRVARVAGINAFAAGGYNAHVVIEECLPPAAAEAPKGGPQAIVLSATTQSGLTSRLRDWRDWLQRTGADVTLADVAATSQRRDAQKHRMAFVVDRIDDLAPLMDMLLAGGTLPPGAFASTHSGESPRETGNAELPPTGQLVPWANLAAQWCAGRSVDWALLARRTGGRLLPDLPGTRFEGKRHWLPDLPAPAPAAVPATRLHPLLHENVSRLGQQRYRTCFVGDEPVLAEHRVLGRKVLPGVAVLEMVRAAVVDALRPQGDAATPEAARLANVVWLQPIAIDTDPPRPVEVFVELKSILSSTLADGPMLGFEVASFDAGQRRLHCQGSAWVRSGATPPPPAVDLTALRAAHQPASMSSAQLYASYAALGIEYGPRYRGVVALFASHDPAGTPTVLAEIVPPAGADADCVLSPALMDAAVHAAMALLAGDDMQSPPRQPPLPFALESLELLHPCDERMWARIRHAPRPELAPDVDEEAGSGVRKIDIDLLSSDGRVCVRMGRLSLRSGEKPAPRPQPITTSSAQITAEPTRADALRAQVLAELRDEVSAVLQVSATEVDPHEELSQYGFDSINLTQFGNRLNERYGLPADRPLNPTIFFEYPTLHGFAGYLVARYRDAIVAATGHAADRFTEAPTASMAPVVPSMPAAEPVAQPLPRMEANAAASRRDGVDVAIVGISGRFPMAADIDEFWRNLAAGRDCITEVPGERWDWRAIFGHPQKEPHRTDVKWGGFIDGIAEFDPLFFGISPREAELMDPQHRLLMQHTWQAIEDSGTDPRRLAGSRTGVFLATASSGYIGLLTQSGHAIEGSTITGTVPSVGPNRISYFLGLHGPSEPIETACSSSLVAIHRAIVAMQAGTCDAALVGGVNTVITPEGHIGFRRAGMLCEDGRCKAFSKHANGYVRGEGVGVLYLKRLADAERDGDSIYAVIKGSAENHGGRANSLTAPNPKAQAELVATAHRQAGIDPRSVSYIEAHGTGTELGDPIEINGLKSAFAELYSDVGATAPVQPHCGLGSVKSNIGHLELAAGVAGVVKVLMQMRHRTLVRSVHSDEPNPYLLLEGSPFYVVQQARPWDACSDSNGRVLPRRAGVSAFGFGGSNAHVVLEEYPAADLSASAAPLGTVLVPLSARTQPQLQQAAQQLLRSLNDGQHHGWPISAHTLRDLAYTLQVGRDAMEERLALVVTSLDELRAGLNAVVDGATHGRGLYLGGTRANREAMAVFQDDEDVEQAVATWLAKGKLAKVAELWVKGLKVDWQRLYGTDTAMRPRRISLPAYPFARERYWVPLPQAVTAPGITAATARLHPLLHDNVSDFTCQRYRARFSGEEFFLRDHVALGQRVLPAVTYLEMGRAALADASHAPVRRLRNVVWMLPMRAEPGAVLDVRVELALQDDGEVAFQVRTISPDSSEPRLHCQGLAAFDAAAGQGEARLDIDALRRRCSGRTLSADAVYSAFDSLGLSYGPGHRAIAELHVATGSVPEALAQLQLPAALLPTLSDHGLHPSLLDAALQAGIGLLWRDGAVPAGRPMLPFHLKSLEPLAPCSASMWAWVRPAAQAAAERSTQALDIDLCDDAGRVCVRIQGLLSRALPERDRPSADLSVVATKQPRSLLLAPVAEPLQGAVVGDLVPAPNQNILVLSADVDAAATLRGLYPAARVANALSADPKTLLDGIDHCIWVAPDSAPDSVVAEAIVEDQERGVFQLFRTVKALLAYGHSARPLGCTVITSGVSLRHTPVNPTHASAAALAGSLAKEMPAWRVRSIDLPSGWARGGSAGALLRQALTLPCATGGSAWARQDDGWVQHKLAPLHHIEQGVAGRVRESAYRMHGVYVVIGGAGGIGEVWTEYMVRTYQAQVVWIGRRALDDALRATLDRLGRLGPQPLYLSADATQLESLQAAHDAIRSRFPRIHGVVHSAAVLQDRSLALMEEDSLRAVLAAKVNTSLRMAQVFGAEQLDFVLFFSSLVAFVRPPGQANYVAGCAFTDAFAQRLAQDWPCAVKVMNWGYWGGVGVAASPELNARMEKLGIGSIEPAEALEALEILLSNSAAQVALVNVTRPLAELARGAYASFLALPAEAAPPAVIAAPPALTAPPERPAAAVASAGAVEVEAYAIASIKRILAQALKVDAGAIDIDEPFTGYGLDSITGVHLAQTLNEAFGIEVDVTLFFDHGTVRRLADLLLAEHFEAIARSCGQPVNDAGKAAVSAHAAGTASPGPESPAGSPAAPVLAGSRFRPQTRATETLPEDAIAIVGLSAAFAGAPDAETFWRNQLAGINSVTAVPPQRWDWKQVSGDPTQSFDRGCFKWGGFLDGIDAFDAKFFGITPEEANYMSPQQRLVLTHAWKALEDAAIAPRELRRNPTGVFIATVPSEYLNTVSDPKDLLLMVTGLSTSMIPSRISHSLDLHGPSELCDTACSSTLVALHRAVQAIRNGECLQAIVGAVNLLLTPAGHIGFEAMGYLSASGRMAAFQAEADGFVRAEGVGVVIVKPLRRAVADGNRIHAVIRGIGVAHGGHTISMTTPNGNGMREAIRLAYEPGGLDPRSVAYVEAHGTASPLGDTIEFNALKSEFQRLAAGVGPGSQGLVERQQVGSAKPCIGYPEVASGMAGLVRVVMALRDRVLPGIAGFTRVHDNLASKTGSFHFTAENAPWPAAHDAAGRPLPRRAAINSYGFSGINAHLVLEEYLPPTEADTTTAATPGAPAELVPLSARSAQALRDMVRQLLRALEVRPEPTLTDVAFTLQHGRDTMDHRLALVARDRAELMTALRHVAQGGEDAGQDGVRVHRGIAVRGGSAADADALETWLQARDLEALARHWVGGGDLPWSRLLAARSGRRIALPGHPLATVRHWVEGGTGMGALHGARPRRARRGGGAVRAAAASVSVSDSSPGSAQALSSTDSTLNTSQESR